jgi:hypothetical protein
MRIDAAEEPEFWGCFSLLGDLAVPFSILANGFAIDHQANGIDKNQDNRSDSQEEANQEEANQEEANQEEANQEEANQEEANQEEANQEEANQEEAKSDIDFPRARYALASYKRKLLI